MKPQLRNSLRRPIHDSNSVDDTNFFFYFLSRGRRVKTVLLNIAMPVEPRKKGLGKQKKFYDAKNIKKTVSNSSMSHRSVIRNLDNHQSKLLGPPYHNRSHKNEKMSQLSEKGFNFPRKLLSSGVRKKRAPFAQLSLSSLKDVSI